MITRRKTTLALLSTGGLTFLSAGWARAASAAALVAASNKALANLYALEPNTAVLATRAKGILVFPNIMKAGFLIGAETGDGTFYQNGAATAYYNISAASYGLQAGVESFSYALFFMNDAAVNYLSTSDGWSIGAGPSVVVLDEGKAASVTSSTLTQDVYAIPFGERGLMAGMGLQGCKITRIQPGP
ncbi:MAG TPA: lipid-binding SYLF domain-containing protein [Acidocella sp.]|jgi:lipid-binding SYLF domain-containing protein|nr:lipid-binding SYLF domain-containing protein [Acidocella sp.]